RAERSRRNDAPSPFPGEREAPAASAPSADTRAESRSAQGAGTAGVAASPPVAATEPAPPPPPAAKPAATPPPAMARQAPRAMEAPRTDDAARDGASEQALATGALAK